MTFPEVIVECAFSNTSSERTSATTGYTEITKYVESVSGTLRGRAYELDRVETGSISVELDNSDGRFTPGSSRSPYFPYVKANRRFRIRGKNLQQLNIGRAGGQTYDTDGFFRGTQYVKDASDGATYRVTEPVLSTHNPTTLGFAGLLLDEPYHIESTIEAGAAPGTYRVLSWWAPMEPGVRSTHSAYVWRVSGTEPAGTLVSVVNCYYDADGNEISRSDGDAKAEWSVPTATAPTRRSFADLPPSNAAYMIQSVQLVTANATTQDITYAVNGIQSEYPANLVPSISGYRDIESWALTGGGTVARSSTDPATVYVLVTWSGAASELSTVVPHLVPGDDYTFVVEARKSGGPDILLTGNDGLSGDTLTADNVWTTLRTSFTSPRAEQAVKLIPQGTPAAGVTLWLRLARCVAGSDPALALAGSSTDAEATDWQHPIPVFEGWVERWPVRTTPSASTITITVNDRLKKLGEVSMESTLKQTLITDDADLLIPFTDPSQASSASILGGWSDAMQASQLTPLSTKYGAGSATVAFGGEIGPTEEDAVTLTQVTSNQGHVLTLPSSAASYASLTTYTKTYYATWNQAYDGSGNKRTDTWSNGTIHDTLAIEQGHGVGYSPDYGNEYSLIGFNYVAIMADLADASIVGATFSLYADWWGDFNGLSNKGFIGLHAVGTKPNTFSSASGMPRLWTVSGWSHEEWRTISLDVASVILFQTGAAKGFMVGPGDEDIQSWGLFEGVTYVNRPYMTITYKK